MNRDDLAQDVKVFIVAGILRAIPTEVWESSDFVREIHQQQGPIEKIVDARCLSELGCPMAYSPSLDDMVFVHWMRGSRIMIEDPQGLRRKPNTREAESITKALNPLLTALGEEPVTWMDVYYGKAGITQQSEGD